MVKTGSSLKKGDQTRRRIIEKSAPIFNQHGYAGTSMSELMAATGLEKGGIYRHFKSKRSLAGAAFDYAWEAVKIPRHQGIESCTSSLEKLLLLVRNFVEEPVKAIPGGCPLLNTAVDSDDGDSLLRSKVSSALAQWRAKISGLVREGQRDGELRKEVDPDSVAVLLIASLEGSVMMSRLEKSREPLRTVGKHLGEYLASLAVRTD
ncbi:Transcriptional regulator, TetR family [Acidisarcina polymorpha]|uniref:Transcriptional regulator, TetR family n=1 Tax=Acidisarcina polymorpha TaxID=2211140 RepID=A0A2Z5G4W6_9BACT|nr:TetR/AcrR family transcriptional regulator [Acidisarcina polymorpha]AXC13705.1 Transcriptional regulator, TetR family [Acidisarcina polymorpha]